MGPRATDRPASLSYRSELPTVPKVLSYYLALIVAWIGAWLLHNGANLASQSESVDTLYWTVAKLFVWLLPIPIVVRAWTTSSVAGYLSTGNLRRGVQTGVGFGI